MNELFVDVVPELLSGGDTLGDERRFSVRHQLKGESGNNVGSPSQIGNNLTVLVVNLPSTITHLRTKKYPPGVNGSLPRHCQGQHPRLPIGSLAVEPGSPRRRACRAFVFIPNQSLLQTFPSPTLASTPWHSSKHPRVFWGCLVRRCCDVSAQTRPLTLLQWLPGECTRHVDLLGSAAFAPVQTDIKGNIVVSWWDHPR